MIEFAAFAVVGGTIAATVRFGTRYIVAQKVRTIPFENAMNEPLVRPDHPSGKDWAT